MASVDCGARADVVPEPLVERDPRTCKVPKQAATSSAAVIATLAVRSIADTASGPECAQTSRSESHTAVDSASALSMDSTAVRSLVKASNPLSA
jgi:hypothetical protein